MYPVLGCLSDEILLLATCCGVTFDRTTTCANLIVEFGKIDNSLIIVVLEEWPCIETSSKHRLEMPMGHLVMLLDDLLKAGIIQLGELGKIMHIRDDIRKILLE